MLRLIVLVVLTLATIHVGTAGERLPVERIEALVSTEMSRQGIPGMSVAVAIDNQLRYSHGFGHADVENSVPVVATTRFRTASIAKPITAVLAMIQVEADKLDLDEPVDTYVPEFAGKRWPVSSRQLMSHLSGVRHYNSSAEASSTAHFFSLKSALSQFASDPLKHEPGTKYLYSSFGYNLLGSVIEGATERDFMELLHEQVLQPAGMHHTRSDNHFAIIPRRARGYVRLSQQAIDRLPPENGLTAGALSRATLHDTSMKIPGGGLLSTAADLVRFATAVNRRELVSQPSLDVMWTEQKTTDDKQTGYGLGWSIGEHQGEPLISHGGGQAGTATYLMLLPDSRIAVALMSNLQGAKIMALARSIADACQADEGSQASSEQ